MATTKKKTATKKPKLQSFVRTPSPKPFMTLQITEQTLYWLILGLLILGLGIWVNTFSVKTQMIYDEADSNNSTQTTAPYHKQ